MALFGTFTVNNQFFSPLTIFGVGTFQAYSGDQGYRNRGGCTAVPNKGPIPAGRYWIVERPEGGLRSKMQAGIWDFYHSLNGTPTHRDEWFGLSKDDGQIDDTVQVNGVARGNFRLHPSGGSGVSFGCITLQSYTDFAAIRRALLNTIRMPIGNTGLTAYGFIEVTTYGNTCP
ncbi:hypothetical protein PMO31116_00148 [Pandoraea morbifera]|uniref:Tlde1 domain-containing protein n=1 Tax=Pandoraea morbifera TaxID=2508300 RepID=A0A5E4RHD7_9BURK|nr:DUF2778 domain-containing protein [Pandoraea morbifera]VVD61942.1 hypothetical protein PMO31116_00148 [Pandoraea morbifera]